MLSGGMKGMHTPGLQHGTKVLHGRPPCAQIGVGVGPLGTVAVDAGVSVTEGVSEGVSVGVPVTSGVSVGTLVAAGLPVGVRVPPGNTRFSSPHPIANRMPNAVAADRSARPALRLRLERDGGAVIRSGRGARGLVAKFLRDAHAVLMRATLLQSLTEIAQTPTSPLRTTRATLTDLLPARDRSHGLPPAGYLTRFATAERILDRRVRGSLPNGHPVARSP